MTLTEFLLARIAEDEAIARESFTAPNSKYDNPIDGPNTGWVTYDKIVVDCGEDEATAAHIVRFRPARVLAECAAMRDVIRCAWDAHCAIEGEWGSGQSEKQMSANDDNPGVVRFLASVYADHPDYLEEWKP